VTKISFDWADPRHLDSQLEPAERAVREAARAYCLDGLAPRELEAFRAER